MNLTCRGYLYGMFDEFLQLARGHEERLRCLLEARRTLWECGVPCRLLICVLGNVLISCKLLGRRLGEHRRWSQNGHKTGATLKP
jgi:hypothetical protein